jgi:hypothetical protein
MEASAEEVASYPRITDKIKKVFVKACAHLFRKENLILIRAEQARVKKRMDAGHELGHDVDPLHLHLNFACGETDLDPVTHERIEREAFQCGAEILFPTDLFLSDATSLCIGTGAIQSLSKRYDAPLEATAIKFAQHHPGLVAVVVAEPYLPMAGMNGGGVPLPNIVPVWERNGFVPPPKESRWITQHTFGGAAITDGVKFPLRVKYSVPSNRFPKRFIAPGTPIPETSPIFQTYTTGDSWRGELAASDLGSSWLRPPYQAECFTFGFNGHQKVMVLLWFEDRQLNFLEKLQ